MDIVRRAYGAFAEQGVEAGLAFIDPEFEVATPPSLASEPDTYRGHDGVRRWFGAFDDGLEDVYLEPRELTDAGDDVLVETVLHGRGRTTGLDVTQVAFLVWTMRDGKAVRVEAFPERGQALEAAGLTE